MSTNKADLKELLKISKLSLDDILLQIRDWYDRWNELAKTIREEYDEEDRLYNNQKKHKEKIGDNTYYSVVNSLMAREYIDRPTSQFQWNSPAQFQTIKNLNSALDSDFNTKEYEILRFSLLEDKYRRWVGIWARKGWDALKVMPKIDAIDPRLAIFDPDWEYFNDVYDYFWFETNDYIDSMRNKGFFNLEDLVPWNYDKDWPNKTKRDDQENAWLLNQTQNSQNNPSIVCFYYFGKFNWQRALVVTAQQNTEIVYVKLIKNDEKLKSFEDILAFRYYRPSRNNPYGMRVAKLWVADLQRVKAQIANLRLDKSKAELYPMYLYNTRLITNKEDLNFWFNKLVATNPLEWEPLNNAVAPLQKDFRADNSYLIDDSLDKQVSDITSINKLAQWSSPERREAATTNKILQDNTDINIAFNSKIDAAWEESLLRIWLAGYIDKMEDWDKKLIYINTWFGQLPRYLTKKDFVTDLFVKIKIETKVEIEDQKQVDRVAYAQMIGFLQWLPNRSESAQLNTYRNFARSWGLSEAQIDMELPATAQEIIAQENVWLLLDWETVHATPDLDPDTQLLAIQAAWNTPNVDIFRYELLKLKKIKKIEQQQPEQQWAVANNLAAQAGAAASNEAISLQNK